MQISEDKPIFLQIYEGIEEAIVSGAFPEEGQIPSTTEFSVTYKINPATVLKGVTMLVDEGIIYKKRGVGMFVAKGAREKVLNKRREQFYDRFVGQMVAEAKRLGISREELDRMIGKGYQDA